VTPRETKSIWGTGGRNLIVTVITVLTLVSALWLGASSWNDSTSRQSASWVSSPDSYSADDLATTARGSDMAVLSGAS
jgi:hypothetical protein